MIFNKDKISEQLEANKNLLLDKFPTIAHYISLDNDQWLFDIYTVDSFTVGVNIQQDPTQTIHRFSLNYGRDRNGYWSLLKEKMLERLELENKAPIDPRVFYPDTGNPLRKGFADDLTGMLKGIIEI